MRLIAVLKRYLVVSVLIILCFFSAFFALCNGLLSVARANSIIRKERQYAYTNEVTASMRFSCEITPEVLLDMTEGIDICNIYIENMTIYFDKTDNVYRPDILLLQNETLSLPTSKPMSLLPDGAIIATQASISDNTSLSIHGKSFYVFDTMNSDEYPFVQGLFVLNAENYFEAFPDALTNLNEITLRITSNKDDVYSAASRLEENAESYLPGSMIHFSEVVYTGNIFQSLLSQENFISAGLFVFAIVNTVILSYYWIMVRRREISVRKAFGASNADIIKLLSIDMICLIGFSALCAFMVQSVIWSVRGDISGIGNPLAMLLTLILFTLVSSLVSMTVPAYYVLRIQPAEGIKL